VGLQKVFPPLPRVAEDSNLLKGYGLKMGRLAEALVGRRFLFPRLAMTPL
jgi:hypothetical protein